MLISVPKAAVLLGVTQETVRAWIRRGRLTGKVVEVRRKQQFVYRASLKDAFSVTCEWCRKEFKARHPLEAKYCSRHHQLLAKRAHTAKGK